MDEEKPPHVITTAKKRRLSLPEHVQQFIMCLIFRLGWPGLPLSLELWITGNISAKSIALTGYMYGFSLGVGSRNLLLLLISLATGSLCGIFFGMASGQGLSTTPFRIMIGIIVGMFILHLTDRFIRHLVNREPFLEFEPKGN
jgi:hypothetical protein